VLGNRVQHVERVDSDVGSLVGNSDESIVQEYVEPGFIKLGLLSQNIGLACVHKLFILQVSLQALDNLNLKFLVLRLVTRDMCKDNFANLLPLVGALTDQRAVASEKVLGEEFQEIGLRTVFIFVNMAN